MDERNYNQIDPWDRGVYETGRTRPPKSRGGLIAFLLVVIILLGGVVSALSILNIRLFAQLQSQEAGDSLLSVILEATEPTQTVTDPTAPTAGYHGDAAITLQPSPQSEDNELVQGGLSLQEIYEKNIPSVVSITCNTGGGASTGTGVVISTDGFIVTNAHVVDGASTVRVLLTDDREFYATLVGADAISDLAVLRIHADGLTPAVFGDSAELRVGDAVAAIGDPLGQEFRGTMTDGIISAINRDVTTGGRTLTLIQTNAALNSGNSGGPLINCYGQVIGINTMKISTFVSDAGVEGLGFAIPSATVKEIAEQLIAQGYVSGRPDLGLSGESVSVFYQRYYGLPAGLYITAVEEGSSADHLGIEPGDILLSLDGVRVTDADSFTSVLYSANVGDVLEGIIYRGRQQYSVRLTVTEDTN